MARRVRLIQLIQEGLDLGGQQDLPLRTAPFRQVKNILNLAAGGGQAGGSTAAGHRDAVPVSGVLPVFRAARG